ncbi:hypothetical protein BS47DRAFT_829075 [Hydnum rufescens UP504]|uniref:Uncharacterized protein n=1 Tax=Hydnum rufescens UP504 TaxID=1448309 RepID=A0A9P6DU31_9AGAM|nr:hypothetical protein BS47DRAFT_829075 [Hydnum rufescens UP504]
MNFWGETQEKLPFLVADVDMDGLDREYWGRIWKCHPQVGAALSVGPPPHFSVMGNGTPEQIQNVVDILCRSGSFPCHEKSASSTRSSAYETERMPPITEILKLMTNLHTSLWEPTRYTNKNSNQPTCTQSMCDRGMTSKDASQSVYPGFVHDHVLGVNYQCSKIVLDRRFDRKKNVNNVNKVYMPCGDDDKPIQGGGGRAPDAPNLVLGPVVAEDGAGPRTMTLFDRSRPFSHTALVFELPEGPPC